MVIFHSYVHVYQRVTYVNHFQAHSAAESTHFFRKKSGYRALDWAALSDFNETVAALKRGGKAVEAKWGNSVTLVWEHSGFVWLIYG